MIKLYCFLTGGSDPFAHQGPAAAAVLQAAGTGATGYVQTRTLSEQVEQDAKPPYAGVAELWFTDAAPALALLADPTPLTPLLTGGGAAIGALLTGHERIVMRLPEHHRGGHIKGVFPFRRKASLSVADFQHHWWHTHGPIAALTESALCYVQCHPLHGLYTDTKRPPFDGVTELHWPDVASARRAMASRQMREDQAGDAANFVEPDSVILFLAEEEAVIPA